MRERDPVPIAWASKRSRDGLDVLTKGKNLPEIEPE
jgi:hypothetical protein